MMANKELYQFLLNKTWQLTEQWYESLDKSDPAGVYSSEDPKVIETLKQQNYEFHVNFYKVFDETISESQFYKDFEKWIEIIVKDEEHLRTPVPFILREFFRVQNQYLDLIEEFVRSSENKYSYEIINEWNRAIIKNFHLIIAAFTEESHKYSESRLESQREMINELSSPVISLSDNLALLPLVGDIDTIRAKHILESTLKQCSDQKIDHLLIDLSGVVIVDTMVAHQIFELIATLDLLGIKSTLSGIRPEIAQTSVQIGIDFSNISIVSTLKQAINKFM